MFQLMSHLHDENPVTRHTARSILGNPKVVTFAGAWHPGDARTVMSQYRRHILGCKRHWGSARGLMKYREFIATYKLAKRECLSHQASGE
jgi:hypothetical protein